MNLRPALLMAALLATPTLVHAERGFEIRDLATLDRVSSPTLSPDGRKLVFAKRVVDFDANKASTSLWIEDLFARDAAPPTRFTPEGWNVNSPSFSPDGGMVYFLSGKSGRSQLYAMPVTGGDPKQVTEFALDVDGYKLSPDGKQVALAFSVFPDCKASASQNPIDCTKTKLDADGKNKASGVVFDRMFIRHWDTWADGRLNRVFVATLGNEATVKTAHLIGSDVVGDIPSKPFGDLTDLAWSPDGKSIIFSARKADREEPWSTNFDLYQVNADGSGAAKNLTASNPAWDAGPVFSHDGQTLYYRAMERPGFEADRFDLMAMDLGSGSLRKIAIDCCAEADDSNVPDSDAPTLDDGFDHWELSADSIQLSEDGKTIYTTAQQLGNHPLFEIDVDGDGISQMIGGETVSEIAIAGNTLVSLRNSLKTGNRIYVSSLNGKPGPGAEFSRVITPSAGEMLPEVRFGEYEQFAFKGWNDETVYGYVVKPWNYMEGKKYPVAFLIHGGPQGSFGNGWSYRWNPQTYAGQGYAVVMIDFHGSTGYGQAFTDAISQHWGDRPLEDLQKGWKAALQKYDFLDSDKACALGASYGGYMVNWIAGNWQQPWKCLVSHDGVFDNRAMGYATEELWFSEWENGGTVYDHPDRYEKFNPVTHVSEFRVPMLVIHSQQDFRIPVEQGIALFHALQRKGVESKFLYFPDENHWVLKPQNSVQWHDTVNAWLKQHIGEQ